VYLLSSPGKDSFLVGRRRAALGEGTDMRLGSRAATSGDVSFPNCNAPYDNFGTTGARIGVRLQRQDTASKMDYIPCITC
jgi:hypothetical protein